MSPTQHLRLAIILLFAPLAVNAASPAELVERGDAAFFGYSGEQSYARAAALYHQAAELGSIEARYSLGQMYAQGLGVPIDHKRALTYFQQAADQQHAPALFSLAQIHERGSGVQPNLRHAFKLYKRSAEQGYVPAQIRLGWMYAQGTGTPVSLTWATYYSALAAASGSSDAQRLLEQLLPKLPRYTTQLEYSTLWALPSEESPPVGQVYIGSEVFQLEQISPEWMVVYSPEARKVAYLNMMSFVPLTPTAAGGTR